MEYSFHSITPSLHHSITPSLHHSITPSLHHSITPSQSRIEIQRRSPTGRRAQRTRQVEAQNPVEHTYTGSGGQQRTAIRELIARSRPPGITEGNQPHCRQAIPDLQPAAPECLANQRCILVATQGPGSTDVPQVLHWNGIRGHARGVFGSCVETTRQWNTKAKCQCGAGKIECPGRAVTVN